MKTLLAALLLGIFAVPAQAQFTYKNVQVRTSFGAANQGNKGLLLVDGKKVRFTKNNGRTEYFSIPVDSVTQVFCSRVSGRRIGAAILVSPLLLFSKGRKHYMTISFNDGKELAGAVEFKLHKNNYLGVLRTMEEVTGLTMEYDQEGVKDTKQTIATRGSATGNQGTVEITSDPEGAEVEIDGAFTGNTPRTNTLKPWQHKITLRKKGYAAWQRKITVEAGETLEIHAELEDK